MVRQRLVEGSAVVRACGALCLVCEEVQLFLLFSRSCLATFSVGTLELSNLILTWVLNQSESEVCFQLRLDLTFAHFPN